MAVLPPASVLRLVSAVPLPTAPPKVVVPTVLTVNVWAPSSVLPRVILPAVPVPLLANVVSAARVVALL